MISEISRLFDTPLTNLLDLHVGQALVLVVICGALAWLFRR